ncbi:MAG: hypothetical protein KF889_14725, partial [Alphaproteobacteria bacterium]|nr:hypothetical protein [Alphaproteobacteria bacterium]
MSKRVGVPLESGHTVRPQPCRISWLTRTAAVTLLAAGLFAASGQAHAQLPTEGTVVGGSATITQNGTSQLTIN